MKAIREFATRDALMQAAAERIADALTKGIAERGAGCAALSGGSTPEPAYRALAALPLDWPSITFLLVDERFVAPTDAASNEGMLRRALGPALAAGARLVPMYASGESPTDAARRANQHYAAHHIDIALMGMGEDGHTASWFPGMPNLNEALDRSNSGVVIAVHAPQAAGSADRLTLTRAALAEASCVLLLITGAAKRQRLRSATGVQDAPVNALFEPPAAPAEIFWAA